MKNIENALSINLYVDFDVTNPVSNIMI